MSRRPIHPGEILLYEFMVPKDMTMIAVSNLTGLALSEVRDIVLEDAPLSEDAIAKLAAAFGTTPDFWRNLQKTYDCLLADNEA